MSEQPRCQACNEPIQGWSRLCIACFRKRHRPCPYCMHWTGTHWVVKSAEGNRRQPLNCRQCANERWILAEEGK